MSQAPTPSAAIPATAPQATAARHRLSPSTRARLIYDEAQAGAATRLWEPALGDRVDRTPIQHRDSLGAGALAVSQGTGGGVAATLLALATSAPSAATSGSLGAHRDLASRHRASPPRDEPSPMVSATTLGPNRGYAPWLRAAADRTGIPGQAIAAIVGAEAGKASDGRWLPLSRNPRSSAAGLGQFLARTWIGEAERAGTWLHQLSAANGWLSPQGRVRREAQSALLALRYDARAAIETVADHACHNLAQLRRAGASAGESLEAVTRTAYVAHHLGIGDAISFLRGALEPARAARLLVAQIGVNAAADRIGRSVDAAAAHRSWLTDFIARAVKIMQTN
jgi:hypothetical protein